MALLVVEKQTIVILFDTNTLGLTGVMETTRGKNNMGKYTSGDNRSMQLNENNDRYYSSRGIDRFDDADDDVNYRYQMQTAEINRHSRQEYDRARAEHSRWACPHGCHETSPYGPEQYQEYKCYHRVQLKDLPRRLKNLKWAKEHAPRRVHLENINVNQALKVLHEIPYIPSVWNVGYTRESISEGR